MCVLHLGGVCRVVNVACMSCVMWCALHVVTCPCPLLTTTLNPLQPHGPSSTTIHPHIRPSTTIRHNEPLSNLTNLHQPPSTPPTPIMHHQPLSTPINLLQPPPTRLHRHLACLLMFYIRVFAKKLAILMVKESKEAVTEKPLDRLVAALKVDASSWIPKVVVV